MANEKFGKYIAYVRDVKDPMQKGRIKVQCPKIFGDGLSDWCEPVVPVAYNAHGDLALPKLNETVYIEFEEGDIKRPLYVGNFWAQFNTPLKAFDYDTNVRIINWDNCSIAMKGEEMMILAPKKLYIQVGNSKITLTPNNIKMLADRIDLNE